MRKRITWLIGISMICVLIGCGKNESKASKSEEETVMKETVSDDSETATEGNTSVISTVNTDAEDFYLSVWPTYWDDETVLPEITTMQKDIDSICYFAAYFDDKGEPFIPEKSLQTKQEVANTLTDFQPEEYLTFVNDKLLAGGGSSLKDTELLYSLLEDPTARTQHIDQILSMISENDFDGIEIDYEAIKKDMNLWNIFVSFVDELCDQASEQGIKVRILLEPNAPIDQLDFPEGPEYVCMCYNLYGYGTEPGPKANKAFIEEMVDKISMLPEPHGMAFSVGGFDFAADGSVKQVTEAQCVELLETYESEIIRDEDSQDIVFSYTAEDGSNHEVWYADFTTLQYWISVGQGLGETRFTIWRLGSNVSLQGF